MSLIKIMLSLVVILLFTSAHAQTGNHVFSGAEMSNFGVVSLSTSTSWSTDRMAAPGYFSAVGAATYTDADDTHNVDGYVKHYVRAADQGFTFPVGSGTDLRSLSTSGTIANNSELATAWIAGDPSGNLDPTAPDAGAHDVTSLGAGIADVSTIGQWDWQDISNTAAGVTVTVSIPDMTAFADASDLILVGWNGSEWVNLSGTTGASGNTEDSSLAGTMISGITAIAIGKACGTLEVKVFLEGPFVLGTGLMTTKLNEFHILPGQDPAQSANIGARIFGAATPLGQPYNAAPWNYSGLEGDSYGDASDRINYPANITDWVLVSVRESDSLRVNEIWKCAGLLENDGDVVFPDNCPCLDVESLEDYFIVVEHRNHLPVMSGLVKANANVLGFDFTQTDSWVFEPFPGFELGNGQIQIGGQYFMYSANSEQGIGTRIINASDNSQWLADNGSIFKYVVGDHNMSGDTNATDKVNWLLNNTVFTLLPY